MREDTERCLVAKVVRCFVTEGLGWAEKGSTRGHRGFDTGQMNCGRTKGMQNAAALLPLRNTSILSSAAGNILTRKESG